VVQESSKEDHPTSAASASKADGFSPVPQMEKQFFRNPCAFPPSTSGVKFSRGSVEGDRSSPDLDVLSPATELRLDPPVEDRSVQVMEEEGREMKSMAARRMKRASDVDMAIKRVSRELQNSRNERFASEPRGSP